MRTVLLASVAALALSVAPAMAQPVAGSHGFINKSANAAGGSNAASTGGMAGNHDGNTSVDVHKNLSSSASSNSASATTGGTALNHSANNDPIASGNEVASGNTKTTTVNKSSSAGGGAGGAASATTGGTAVNKDNNDALSLLSGNSTTVASDNELTNDSSHISVDVTLAESSVHGSASGGGGGHGFLGGGNVMTNSVNGQGILTAQQNTGGGALQQNSVALGSVVLGSTTNFTNH
jgi:hypothetical protein